MPSFALVAVLLRRYMKVIIASAQKCGGGLESRSIARMPLVATPINPSAPFDKGEYGTGELIRIPLCSQYSLILPATSPLTSSNLTIFYSSIFAVRTSGSASALDWAPDRNTHLACEYSFINPNPYWRRLTDSTAIGPTRSP